MSFSNEPNIFAHSEILVGLSLYSYLLLFTSLVALIGVNNLIQLT